RVHGGCPLPHPPPRGRRQRNTRASRTELVDAAWRAGLGLPSPDPYLLRVAGARNRSLVARYEWRSGLRVSVVRGGNPQLRPVFGLSLCSGGAWRRGGLAAGVLTTDRGSRLERLQERPQFPGADRLLHEFRDPQPVGLHLSFRPLLGR